MPLIVAAILYGGAFFGYTAGDTAHERMMLANQVQQHFLQLKRANINVVKSETIR